MSLDVFLHGERIGALFPTDAGYSFGYRPELVGETSIDAPLLSHSLPVRPEPFAPEASRAYVEGLLPQGTRRETIAAELRLDPADGYGLIAELGRDCLGAVVFLAEGEEIEAVQPDRIAWLGEDELAETVRCPPSRIFDPDEPRRMRSALPGKRHKLALVRDEETNRWAWPEPGLPSTHIVKPEPRDRPGFAAEEHACTLAYRELGLPVVHTSVETIAGIPCLISKRFDRWSEGLDAERLHQESFAQALGIAPDAAARRLATGVPGLGEVSGLLRVIGEGKTVETLMKTTVCDLLIGCTALRGDNGALLFAAGKAMLAPFYGIASTEIYGDVRPRPLVTGIGVPPAPLLIDLQQVIELCRQEPQPAIIESVRVMGQLGIALGAIAEEAWQGDWHRRAIEEALLVTTRRVLGFREESEYLRPPGAEPMR